METNDTIDSDLAASDLAPLPPVGPPRPAIKESARARNTVSRKAIVLRYAAAIAVIMIAGAFVARYIERRGADPTVARRLIQNDIAGGGILEPGETVEARADLLQRHWSDYYRPTPTTVLATDRRLVVLMVPPKVLPPAAWDPVPASVEAYSMPYDSVQATSARIFFGAERGLVLKSRTNTISLAAYPGQASNMSAVERNIRRHEVERQIAIEREKQLQKEAEERAKQPIYHTVQPGEAVSSISDLYGITPERLRELNKLPNDKIKVGQKLLVKPQT